MKALGGSSSFFICKHDGVVWCSQETGRTKQPPPRFRLHQNRLIVVRDGFSLSRHKFIHPISAASSHQTNIESEEIQTADSADQPKTVRVRFKLYRECSFGQQFLIVGDDPTFGLWDPSDGVLLNWSEGHLWTADMDIPSGKVIKYKFILKGIAGDLSWQPGPDRVLETWDTDKTITVIEDWDNPEMQTIVEEDFVADLNEESFVDSDALIVAENLRETILDEGTDDVIIEELPTVNGHINSHDEMLLSKSLVAENISEELEEKDSSTDNVSGLTSVTDQKEEDNLLSSKDETPIEGVPVLVPGLVPMPLEETEEVVAEESVIIESADSTEPECNSTAQLKDEHVSASAHSRETTSSTETAMDDEREQMCVAEQTESDDILESDMQWGRRTLHKFLANLGFQMTM